MAAPSERPGALGRAAAAFSRLFDGARPAPSSLDPELNGTGATPPSAAGAEASKNEGEALLGRLLEKVKLDDGGDPARGAALKQAFSRMLESPSARGLAERFLASGVPAVVRFVPVEGSRVYESNGRKRFYAPRAFTDWKDGEVEVRVNQDYLESDPEFVDRDLPPTLAHELFGHGLWYARAEKEGVSQAFHHHELNEANARLVGWLTDLELDGYLEEAGTWTYLQDPARFLESLKLRLPYYALTFSNADMAHPLEALESRRAAAAAKRERLEGELANMRTWSPVIDHFVDEHGVSAERFTALRGYLSDTETNYSREIEVMDEILAELDGVISRMKAEPERDSERYLQWAATHPMFQELQRENDENGRKLAEEVRRAKARPEDEPESVTRAREEHWRGQITFDELVRMYHEDRAKRPAHWGG
jgi:hypothetical protein